MFSGEARGYFQGDKDFVLTRDLGYQNNEIMVIAKKGLVVDGASVPRVFWRVIGSPFVGKYRRAAIIHDALYTSQGLGILTRKQCDDIFLEAMEEDGVSYWKRYAMYYAVRLGGGKAWDSVEENGRSYCEIHNVIDISDIH